MGGPSKKDKTLASVYDELQSGFTLEQDNHLSNLVRANGNSEVPVQRWFHFKEAFSTDLLQTLLTDWDVSISSRLRILDPYCGVGTSLLSSQALASLHRKTKFEATGIERNPFIHFVASTKANWHLYDKKNFEKITKRILSRKILPQPISRPKLSTLKREDVFSKHTLAKALSYRAAIDEVDSKEKQLLLLGFASALEEASGVRKDGRALRILTQKKRRSFKVALQESWTRISSDLDQASNIFRPIQTSIHLGDGRTFKTNKPSLGLFDVIIYSPPYLNNIDYSEVYKIELWMSGFVKSQEDFRDLRLSTFRSHPSVLFPDPIGIATNRKLGTVNYVLQKISEAFPKDKNLARRKELLYGYFDDMYLSLKNQILHLEDGGWIFCIVGNSLHGPNNDQTQRVTIAADLLIAEIARLLGLKVRGIQVARKLIRRPPQTEHLRESIIVMQKEG